MPFQLAVQRMTFPSRPLHILKSNRIIQNVKLHSKARRMFRLDAGLRAGLKEPLNALVPEAPDHAMSVYRNATLYALIFANAPRLRTPGH